MDSNLNRRSAVKLIAGAGVSLLLAPRCTFVDPIHPASRAATSPIDRSLPQIAPRAWFDDLPQKAHSVLWDKRSYMQSIDSRAPSAAENAQLIIVGGGMAGLTAAYLLRHYRPIVLEQAPRFGGNAKGQSWRGVDYSTGAAYFIKPEADTPIDRLLRELDLDQACKIKTEEDPVALRGAIYRQFWDGSPAGSDSELRAQILQLADYFRKVNEGDEIPYPDIPISDPQLLGYIRELDQLTFGDHLRRIAGGDLKPEISAALEHYCWSSLGAGLNEVSAAAGLNFYAAEFGELALLPGGNSAVAERLQQRLLQTLPHGHLRPASLVYDMRVSDGEVVVSYRDAAGASHSIVGQAAVMACPKFIVAKVLDGIEPERIQAINRLRYRSYLVANLCLEGGEQAPFYDLYLLGDGAVDSSDLRGASSSGGVTDVIYATYARAVPGSTVLTLYRGLPYDGARAELLADDSYERFRAQFEEQIYREILPLLRIPKEAVVDLRLTRWGHPLPIAAPGLISEGVVDRLRAPFKDRVFFAEQDNWALPAFETAVAEAISAADQVSQLLG